MENYQSRLNLITQKVRTFWEQHRYYDFTFHGPENSQRLCSKLEGLINEFPNKLTDVEEFVLRASAWLYDIGFASTQINYLDSVKEATKPKEIIIQTRKNIQLLSAQLILQSISSRQLQLGLFEDGYTEVITTICKGSSEKTLENTREFNIISEQPNPIRTRLCSILLILADKLYVDPGRVNFEMLKNAGLDLHEYVYWNLFKNIQITAIKNKQIPFSYRVNEDQQMYIPYIRGFIESQFTYENNPLLSFLFEEYGLSLVPGLRPVITISTYQNDRIDEKTINYLIENIEPKIYATERRSQRIFPVLTQNYVSEESEESISPPLDARKIMPPSYISEGSIVNVLFLAANPLDTPRLRLDKELQLIDDILYESEFRSNFRVIAKPAVQKKDLIKYLHQYEPTIVHFCGHGDKAGRIVLEEKGLATPISNIVLSEVFSLMKNITKCVVLNSCYTAKQAKAISESINGCVIGMSYKILDDNALGFADGFYHGVSYNSTIKYAFQLGNIQSNVYQNKSSKRQNPQLHYSNCDIENMRFIG